MPPRYSRVMQPTFRKPFGILLLLAGLALYAGLIASFADAIARLPGWAEAALYLVLGFAWLLPLRPLLQWMTTGTLRPPR